MVDPWIDKARRPLHFGMLIEERTPLAVISDFVPDNHHSHSILPLLPINSIANCRTRDIWLATCRWTYLDLANEERRGADQGTVIDLPHEEVRDIGTADGAESPVPWRGQDAVASSRGPVFQKAWPHNGPVEP